jgi:hypothetical protein
MADETKKVLHGDEIEHSESADFMKVYANSAQVQTSVWDVRLIFGEMEVTQGRATVENSLMVIMSPQHAKALASALSNNIISYEQKIGEIKLPADLNTKLNAK